ncbi:hypothetical protein FRC17_007127 [Serendipita sp. 399]|nr:hypothetical protein FRC17_007127 [Serendipita sp. 399]
MLNVPLQANFFDPSYIPREFRTRNILKLLQKAGKKTPGVLSFSSSGLAQNRRCNRSRQTGHHRRLQPQAASSSQAGSSRPLSISTIRASNISQKGGSPPATNVNSGKSIKSMSPTKVGERTAIEAALQKLDPLLRGETDMKLYGRSLSTVLKTLAIEKVIDEQLHASRKVKLCLAYLVVAVHLTESRQFIEDKSFDASTSNVEKPWSKVSSLDFVIKAQRLFNTIKLADLNYYKDEELTYAFVKVQLSTFHGRLSEAEQGLQDLIGMNIPITSRWLLLFTVRIYTIMSLQYRGLEATIHSLLRTWHGLEEYLLSSAGFSSPFTSRKHVSALREVLFEGLDQNKDLAGWYDNLLMDSSSDDPSTSKLTWSGEDHQRLGSILLSYCCSRSSVLRNTSSVSSATSDLRIAFPRIHRSMKIAGYFIPNELLLRCSYEASRIGNIELAEELRSHYHLQKHNRLLENDLDYGAYSTAALLAQASRTGNVLKAIDLIGTLQSEHALQRRDIRNWLRAYLRAPSYDLQSPSELPSLMTTPLAEVGVYSGHLDAKATTNSAPTESSQDTDTAIDRYSLGDRIDDAEEIFEKVILPQRPKLMEYSIILNAFARRGDIDKVNFWIERMLNDGYPPDKIPWDVALRAFSLAGNAHAVARILQHMNAIERRERAKRTKSTQMASDQEQPEPMSPSLFNILMDLMIQRHDPENADRLWENGVVKGGIIPNFASVTKLLRVHAHAGQWSRVVHIWQNLDKQLPTSPLMTWFGEVARPGDRNAVFWGTTDPAVQARSMTALFNIILQAHVSLGAPFGVVQRVFSRMTENPHFSVEPDALTMTLMVIAASDARMMTEAMEYFTLLDREEQRRGIASVQDSDTRSLSKEEEDRVEKGTTQRRIDYRPIFALTHLMSGYLRSRDIEGAERVWKEIVARGLKPTPFTYALIVKSFVKQRRASESTTTGDENLVAASEFLTRLARKTAEPPAPAPPMERSRKYPMTTAMTIPGIGPQRATGSRPAEMVFAPLLDAYGNRKDLSQVEALWEQMVEIGGDVSISGLTLLMDAYRKAGEVDMVVETWKRVIMVAKRVLQEEADTEEQLFRSMGAPSELEEESLNGDDGNDSKQGQATGDSLEGIRVSNQRKTLLCFPFSILMDSLSAAGRHDALAREWSHLRNSGFTFDSHNWNHLVVALVRAGEVERAFEVVEEVILPYGDASYRALYYAQDEGRRGMIDIESRWSRRVGKMNVFSSDEVRPILEPLLASHAHTQEKGETTDRTGFAHELRILHTLTGPWTAWRPHKRVVQVLGEVILSLENGDVILPVQGEDSFDASMRDVVDNPTHARQLFTRILTKYPKTAKLAYEVRNRNI